MSELPGSYALSYFIGLSGPASSQSVAVLDFPRWEEFLAEKIGLHGAQAMDTIEKVNLSWQIPPVRVSSPSRRWSSWMTKARKLRANRKQVHAAY
jgi:hypothetical protein